MIGPQVARLMSKQTTNSGYLQGRFETGATGLEPANSGVTGRFEDHNE